MDLQNKRLALILSVAGILLLLPFIAMQFSREVNWSSSDFAVAGILLFGTGLAIELILRKIRLAKYRLMLSLAVFVAFLLLWIELAVGIFGTPLAGS